MYANPDHESLWTQNSIGSQLSPSFVDKGFYHFSEEFNPFSMKVFPDSESLLQFNSFNSLPNVNYKLFIYVDRFSKWRVNGRLVCKPKL